MLELESAKISWQGIVAMDLTGAIGQQGVLPWHIKSELQHFKTLTMGHPLVMGYTTFASFKKPLPGRMHLVLSTKHRSDRVDADVHFFATLEELQKFVRVHNFKKVFVAGGASIYQLMQDMIDHWHVSVVQMKVANADTYFSDKSWEKHSKDWELVEQRDYSAEGEIPWQYFQYIKNNILKK